MSVSKYAFIICSIDHNFSTLKLGAVRSLGYVPRMLVMGQRLFRIQTKYFKSTESIVK